MPNWWTVATAFMVGLGLGKLMMTPTSEGVFLMAIAGALFVFAVTVKLIPDAGNEG